MSPPTLPVVKLLLVDDLPENLLALDALLRRPDLELLKAHSGTEALELLLVHDVALALIDVQMPELDGFELAELMRGSERTCRVPIIFVTAGAREAHRIFQGYDAGAVDFLFKPIDQHILRHKVDTFVELHRQRQQLAAQMEIIRANEELKRRILESSQDLMLVVDLKGTLLSFSVEGKERLSGAVGQATVQWSSLWEDPVAASRSFDAARTGEPCRFQSRGQLLDLTRAYWDVAVSPMRDARGRVERLLAVARDVSELRRLNDELADNLRLNETFVAAVGHDLRTPLNNVVMSAELLLSQASEPSQTRVIERLRSSASRMSRMIDELFDLARARLSGGIPVQLRNDVDLTPVAERIVAELATGERGQSLELTHNGDTRGTFDPDRLGQVLSNLLGNALRHGQPESPVQLAVDGSTAHEVVLAVTNRGQIPTDVLSCLFEPFRRGQTRGGSVEGLGLGLFIVQQIVLAHQGRITAESNQGITTFRVVLPRNSEPGSQAPASA